MLRFLFLGAILSLTCYDGLGVEAVQELVNQLQGQVAYSSGHQPGFGPELANDGMTGTDPSIDGCFISDSLDSSPFWLVDLGQATTITTVVIMGRTDCCTSLLVNFEVNVFDDDPRIIPPPTPTECVNVGTASGTPEQTTYQCTSAGGVTGRWVMVKKTGKDLAICEIQAGAMSPAPGCGEKLTTPVGEVKSPAFPTNYALNLNCEWTITAPINHQIFLDFSVVTLDADCGDKIAVYDGPSVEYPRLDDFCASGNRNYKSSRSVLFVVFTSDAAGSSTSQGFTAEYSSMINKIDCTFDNECGFTEPAGGNWIISDTVADTPTPAISSTSSGKYSYVLTDPATSGAISSLLSPKISSSDEHRCLTFSYFLPGSTLSTLSVKGKSEQQGDVLYWKRMDTAYNGDHWSRATLTIPATTVAYQLMFEVVSGAGPGGNIGIDSITLVKGACASDIELTTFECDFEDETLCGMTREFTDTNLDVEWIQDSGTVSASTGPTADHTKATASGHYMYVDSRDSGSHNKIAVLKTPPIFINTGGCFSFWYHMNGPDPTNTNTFALALNIQNSTLFFKEREDLGDKWLRAEVDMSAAFFSTTVQFSLIAQIGSSSTSNVAIDDIRFIDQPCGGIANCDFENGTEYSQCGYTTSMNSDFKWERTDGVLEDGGVSSDHTSGNGYFMYAGEYIPKETAISPTVHWEHDVGCLSFQFAQDESTGMLRVFASLTGAPYLRQLVWEGVSATEGVFSPVNITINTTRPINVEFEAVRGQSHPAVISIDSILLKPGECAGTPVRSLEASTIDCSFDVNTCGYKLSPAYQVVALSGQAGNKITATVGVSTLEQNKGQKAALVSPLFSFNPSYICIRFWHYKKGSNAGRLKVDVETESQIAMELDTGWTADQNWTLAEIDYTHLSPMRIHFIASRSPVTNYLDANIALDDITITLDTCNPVPWRDDWAFKCERPTTPCAETSQCNVDTLTCLCPTGTMGLQCQPVAQPCTLPCSGNGECGVIEGTNTCFCQEGYYGNDCQFEMVNAECSEDSMAVNIYPYGYNSSMTDIPPPDAGNSSCQLEAIASMANTSHLDANMEGYYGVYNHTDDLCGDAVVAVNDTHTTYTRGFRIFYDPLGRHYTDQMVNATCSIPNPPTTTTTTTTPSPLSPMKLSVGFTEYPPFRTFMYNGRLAAGVYGEFKFTLNTPNLEGMDGIKVEQCTASNGAQEKVLVDKECAIHPAGVLLYDGEQSSEEKLIVRVYKFLGQPVRLRLWCRVRVCDTSHDFQCFQRLSCGMGRKKRSSKKTYTGGKTIDIVENIIV